MTGQNDDDNDADTVGYGKPPKKNQFKKGQSGCPSGGHKRRRLNKMDRKAKQAQKLLEKEKSLAETFKKIALEDFPVVAGGARTNMSAHEIIMRKLVRRAMKDDADDKHVRQYLSVATKAGLLDKPPTADPNAGVLVIYSPMQLAEWEAATAGELLSADPLEGIPGTEGIFDKPYARERRPPDDDLD
jgi:hypothetical protein